METVDEVKAFGTSIPSCQIASGRRCLFWHDDWTKLGPLIDITGSNGPRVTGIPTTAIVFQALEINSWLRSNRRHHILVLLRSCIPITPLFQLSKKICSFGRTSLHLLQVYSLLQRLGYLYTLQLQVFCDLVMFGLNRGFQNMLSCSG